MSPLTLVGTTIQDIFVIRGSVHPAWVDQNTLPIAAWSAFLDVLNIGILKVDAAEVDLGPTRYPALGLSLASFPLTELESLASAGSVKAEPLIEARELLPLTVHSIEESDPMGEDTVSQYTIIGSCGQQLILRHIMPPTTLGIALLPPANRAAS